MRISKKGLEAPIISNISFYHNVKREDGSIGDYIVVEYLSKDYRSQVLNVETKVDVNSLDKKIQIKGIAESDVVTIYDLKEQEGHINEK
jgi:hypothetical protein